MDLIFIKRKKIIKKKLFSILPNLLFNVKFRKVVITDKTYSFFIDYNKYSVAIYFSWNTRKNFNNF